MHSSVELKIPLINFAPYFYKWKSTNTLIFLFCSAAYCMSKSETRLRLKQSLLRHTLCSQNFENLPIVCGFPFINNTQCKKLIRGILIDSRNFIEFLVFASFLSGSEIGEMHVVSSTSPHSSFESVFFQYFYQFTV